VPRHAFTDDLAGGVRAPDDRDQLFRLIATRD